MSSWFIARVEPSTTPIATTCSSASADAKRDTLVRREPSGVASNVSAMRIAGIDSSGSPFSSAKESITSYPRGGSMERNSQEPFAFSPVGDVMRYVARLPGANSNVSKVDGHPGGPHTRSS